VDVRKGTEMLTGTALGSLCYWLQILNLTFFMGLLLDIALSLRQLRRCS
jgi:hypothetical protein